MKGAAGGHQLGHLSVLTDLSWRGAGAFRVSWQLRVAASFY